MKWIIGEYTFTSPFSLKSTLATSSGGKTNLLPTMFAIKMALIDAAFRTGWNGEEEFNWIRDLIIRIQPPKKATVQNAFVKILKESRSEVTKENPEMVFSSTVALREYVLFQGPMKIAINIEGLTEKNVDTLQQLMLHINQLGKRGCFVQMLSIKGEMDLQGAFTFFLNDKEIQLPQSLMIQHLDDMGEKATFETISNFNIKKSTIGKDRCLIPVGVPYELVKSSRGFSHYERIN